MNVYRDAQATCGLEADRRVRISTALLGMVLLPSLLAAGANAEGPDRATREAWKKMSQLGDGFVVWESDRSGRWRLYRRELDGSGFRQISPEEKGRDHFCPHLSPDGRRLIYLSYPAGTHTYQHEDPKGPVRIHLLQSDGRNDKIIVDSARAYFEDRAGVWIDNDHLIYIDRKGFTRELDLRNGKSRKLTKSGLSAGGFLINATKSHATTGSPTFSLFDASRSEISGQRGLGGCQPYFTHDGRWGFWMGGGGGPINRIDLETRKVTPILKRNDPRMPKDRNYLYFPMAAADGRLFAFGASPNQHDHFHADYDIFVAPLDPRTLELRGTPVRYSFHKGTDRFPDVFLAPMELGQHSGEAPYTVALEIPDKQQGWHWSFGDGGKSDGAKVKHTYSKPGRYHVRANRKGKQYRGLVVVESASPPQLIGGWLQSDRQIAVQFDEPVKIENLNASLDSRTKIIKSAVDKNGTKLTLELAKNLSKADTLHLRGVTDRAQRPNKLSDQTLKIAPLAWPSSRDGLIFLFQTANAPNQVPGEKGRPPRTYNIHPRGRARFNHDQAMVLAGGAFLAEGADEDVLRACKKSNELTVEAVIRTEHLNQSGPTRIVTFSTNSGSRNFTLGQERQNLVFRLRTPQAGGNGVNPETTLCKISPQTPTHVVVTYRPGHITAYVDGKQVFAGRKVQGDFSNWEPQHLLFGDEFDGHRDWAGTLEGVAIYSRALGADEVQRNANQYRNLIRSRRQVPRIEVSAKLLAKSHVPTLGEIKPYRAALVVSKYRVSKVLQGKLKDKEIFVSQWALLDGQKQPITGMKPGKDVRLSLEPYEDNPQLQRFVCKDDFDGDAELLAPRYYDVGP